MVDFLGNGGVQKWSKKGLQNEDTSRETEKMKSQKRMFFINLGMKNILIFSFSHNI